jgi:hypothetical protein
MRKFHVAKINQENPKLGKFQAARISQKNPKLQNYSKKMSEKFKLGKF